jgi:hypothetical protein
MQPNNPLHSDPLRSAVDEMYGVRRPRFVVIESTPGYLPEDDDPLVTDSYEEAVEEVNRICDELEDAGYVVDRSWASQDNLYAAHAERPDMVAPDLGRTVQIIREED